MGMIPAVHVENKIQWASPHGLWKWVRRPML
jgi:hypothetical protein